MTPSLPSINQSFYSPLATETGTASAFAPETNTDAGAAARRELGLWLAALDSFLVVENHPFADGDAKHALAHNWTSEVRLMRRALLRSASLVSQTSLAINLQADSADTVKNQTNSPTGKELAELFVFLSETVAVCDALAKTENVDLYAWKTFGRRFGDELENLPAFKILSTARQNQNAVNLPHKLENLIVHPAASQPFGRELLEIVSLLTDLLELLKTVGELLERDAPLKLSLLIFAHLHERIRGLQNFVSDRILRFVPAENQFFDLFDGTIYLLTLELRKVFTRELVGVSSLRSPTAVYARVETAHGLLRDCLQQSIVALAQAFEPTLAGAQIFSNFQTRLEQSLVLRRALWHLQQTVRKAENAPDTFPLARLQERAADFRQNSMRFLMYKDCETTERFIEEVLQMRRDTINAHVLHRFGAYLETLLGQVNMRNVLADHPFDYPPVND